MHLTLADAVSVGARVQIWTHSGYYQGTTVEERNYTEDRGAVYIDEGAMIYTNSVIKHGVRIGKFTSIASSSMVNRDVEDFAHASGVPIKVIQRTKLSN
jgi:acetyltransferase-like isoleucine patch superfamily enzyme